MNKNVEQYKKAVNKIKASRDLKNKTLNKISQLEQEENITNAKQINNKKCSKLFNKFIKITYVATPVLATAIIVFSVMLVNDNDGMINISEEVGDIKDIAQVQEQEALPKVGSLKNLDKILETMELKTKEEIKSSLEYSESADLVTMNSSGALSESSALLKDEYSKTNTQVEGVDEADIVKTDGNYIYYIVNKKLLVVNVQNPKNIVIESQIEHEKEYLPKELYIYNNKLVLILDKSKINKNYNSYSNGSLIAYDIAYIDSDTVIITYDMRNKQELIEKRRIEIEGRYIDSRMIKDEIYVVTTKTINYIGESEDGENIDFIPRYIDTAIDNEKHQASIADMLYVPEGKRKNYLNIIGFSLENNKEANIKTVLGAGENVYCTEDTLYITSVKYNKIENEEKNSSTREYLTEIYKFKLEDTNIISKAIGAVKGSILNQFSMGEYNGNLSLVTTHQSLEKEIIYLPSGESIVKATLNSKIENTLYVLDENLNQIGILENIAEDESLYATRFMGDKAYVVTFKRVDPLFVIDLSNPQKPTILGELKIPGYSSYLHPYNENYLIGIGQEVVTEQTKYGEREVTKGVKVSLFDVSNYSNPKEVTSLVINENSYTNAEYNHKAILFMKEKNILAFPMTTYLDGEQKQQYVLLSIDVENSNTDATGDRIQGESKSIGISIKDVIEHGYKETEYGKYMVPIDRGLYINDYFYTLSSEKIDVREWKSLEKVMEILL